MIEDVQQAKEFYQREYSQNQYACYQSIEKAIGYKELKAFIDMYGLHKKKCLEIGCGRGVFQYLVEDYTGVDLSDSVKQYLHKPFYQASATELPFKDNEFDAIWMISVLEHIPNPEKSFLEFRRVLKPESFLFLHAAWQCRP